jgi:hypothetical protein
MLATTALSGCANMADTPPGTPLDAVTAQFGAPTMTCSQPDGATRAIWSQQPFGQYAWATNVTPEGNVGSVDQVLADKAFEQLSEGVWDPQRVQCAFGPPADIDGVGMPSVWKVVWSYRYKQYDVWNSMMYVFFDPQTNIVVDHYPGPDPMFMFDDVWFM